MATRKIKDAKDTTTNEVIYFKGHAKATYMSNGKTVEDAINNIQVGGSGDINLSDYATKEELDALAESADERLSQLEQNVTDLSDVARTGAYDDLEGKPTIPTESTVIEWGFTKNNGTVTSVKINGVTKSPNSNGVVDLGTIESGGGTTVINGVTDVTVDGATVVSDNVATIPLASTSNAGVVRLSSAVNSDNSATAATSAAVKSVNDRVNGKQDAISDIAEIRTNANNAFKGSINGVSEGTLWLVTKVNGKEPNGEGAVTIDVGDKNVQSDWNATSGDAFIKNKPTIPTTLDQLTQSASYRTVTDTEKSTWGGKQDKLVSGTNLRTINGESLLGSGNIEVSGGALAYPLVNHGTSDTTFTLTPNTFHVWGLVTSLSLTLGTAANGIANEYLFQFSTDSSTPTALSLPSSVIWAGGEVPQIEVMKTYQVSILNNCATMLSFG